MTPQYISYIASIQIDKCPMVTYLQICVNTVKMPQKYEH